MSVINTKVIRKIQKFQTIFIGHMSNFKIKGHLMTHELSCLCFGAGDLPIVFVILMQLTRLIQLLNSFINL